MDFFGISAAMRGVVEIYFRGAQQTGRTTQLLESVKAGDVVVFLNMDQAREFERKCRERNIEGVKGISAPRDRIDIVFERPTAEGRLIWDHDWLEAHYKHVIADVGKYLDHVSQQASGNGEAHHKTRMQAMQEARFRPF